MNKDRVFTLPGNFQLRAPRSGDESGTSYVCLKTGDHGKDGEAFYGDDPDALARIYVWPYLTFEPELALILEDTNGICGYALGAFDSHRFYDRYEREWRPKLCAEFPKPNGDPEKWTRAQQIHACYHAPDYFCPEPYAHYPSHMHIDFLERARGRGFGRLMMEEVVRRLQERGSAGAHLAVSILNPQALSFYRKLGFSELIRTGTPTDGCVYMGKRF